MNGSRFNIRRGVAAVLASILATLVQGAVGQDGESFSPERHWAFQPVTKTPVPAVSDARNVENPIDAFIRAELDKRAWRPAPEASRGEWIRRVTFDLTGLPPTSEEVQAFQAARNG